MSLEVLKYNIQYFFYYHIATQSRVDTDHVKVVISQGQIF